MVTKDEFNFLFRFNKGISYKFHDYPFYSTTTTTFNKKQNNLTPLFSFPQE